MSRTYKEFEQYLISDAKPTISNEDYWLQPASALLKYLVEAKDAVNLCQNNFKKNNEGEFTKTFLAKLRHINQAMLSAIMGHFETFQRHIFGGVFDFSAEFEKFNVESFFRKLNKIADISFSPLSLAPYRGESLRSIGIVLADNMPGWHDPERVISYFKCFDDRSNVFSNDDCRRLKVLWELRHSIVHTGGIISASDAQKVDELNSFGDVAIVLENNFTFEIARKLHPIIFKMNKRLRESVLAQLPPGVGSDDVDEIEYFFAAKSSVSVWVPDD